MGVDDHVDIVVVEARRSHVVEKPGVEVIQRRHMGPLAAVPGSGVHDDGQPVHLDHPALDSDTPPVGVWVEEGGHSRSALSCHPEAGVWSNSEDLNSNCHSTTRVTTALPSWIRFVPAINKSSPNKNT